MIDRTTRKGKQEVPKYVQDLLARVEAHPLRPGAVYVVETRHDDWCDLLAGRGPCNCTPEVGEPRRVSPTREN